MLQPIESGDFERLKTVIEDSVRVSVADCEEDARFLIDDIVSSLEDWQRSGCAGFHRKYLVEQRLVGFIVVRDCWNLSHLFVAPPDQGRGIRRELVASAIESCRGKSPRGKIELNSSDVAVDFYRSCGFVLAGPRIERPGGCVPMVHDH